jgi:hypothetical protein
MKKKKILLSLLFTLITILVFYLFIPSEKEICLKAFSDALKLEFKGTVREKFIDNNNHLAPTIIVESGKDSIKITDYRDRSGLFEYLEKGDSIIKSNNSPLITVKRNDVNSSFTITYDCSE